MLMAESEEKLKSFLMKVKEEGGKSGINSIQKNKIMASFTVNRWVNNETMTDFISLGSKITADDD